MVYNAIIVSQMVYGLNTSHLTESDDRRIDAAQLRTLRALLNIEHPFYSRVSNQEVFVKANRAAFKIQEDLEWEQFVQANLGKSKKIRPISELIK